MAHYHGVAETSSESRTKKVVRLFWTFRHQISLQEGMIVRGEIVLASESGHNYHIEVELIAQRRQ